MAESEARRLITAELVHAVAPRCKAPSEWADDLHDAAQWYGIDTPLRVAHWVAQLAHECSEFTLLEENLNYSAERLRAVWPRKFTEEEAKRYERNPEAIANRVYAGRYGNGDEGSGDGWTYRGRGPIMLTFRDNYVVAARGIGTPVDRYPDIVKLPMVGARVAAWFWHYKSLSVGADADDVAWVTKRINGGDNGLQERARYLKVAKTALDIQPTNRL